MARRVSPVPSWVPADLPAGPGVYEFRAAGGTVLYVGKSVNLRRRVRGYFYGGGPKDERMRQMLRMASVVRCQVAGSDLEACLEEADRIDRFRPPYNRALKNRSRGWYIEINWADPFPRLRVVRTTARPRAQYFGPYRGRRLPTETTALLQKVTRIRSCAGAVRPDREGSACLQHGIGLCSAPCICKSGLTEYRNQVELAARLLDDPAAAFETRMRFYAARDKATADDDLDLATDWQRRIDWLHDLDGYRSVLERPWVERSWLIVLPGAEPDLGVLVPVARGRVLRRVAVRWSQPHWHRAVGDACYAVWVSELQSDSVFPASEMTPSLIVTRWLEDGCPGGEAFDLHDMDADAITRHLGVGVAAA